MTTTEINQLIGVGRGVGRTVRDLKDRGREGEEMVYACLWLSGLFHAMISGVLVFELLSID